MSIIRISYDVSKFAWIKMQGIRVKLITLNCANFDTNNGFPRNSSVMQESVGPICCFSIPEMKLISSQFQKVGNEKVFIWGDIAMRHILSPKFHIRASPWYFLDFWLDSCPHFNSSLAHFTTLYLVKKLFCSTQNLKNDWTNHSTWATFTYRIYNNMTINVLLQTSIRKVDVHEKFSLPGAIFFV